MPSNIHSCLIDCALVHAWVDDLYPYARRMTDRIRPRAFPGAVERALQQLGIHPEDREAVYEKVPKRLPALDANEEPLLLP